MSFTYDATALSDDLNRIRLEIGDTDSDRPLLQDEEIEQIISEVSTFHKRVAACARLICSYFSGDPIRFRTEGYWEDDTKAYDRFLELAKLHESKGGGSPWAGSISEDWKETVELDDTLVDPKFKKGMFDYPGT